MQDWIELDSLHVVSDLHLGGRVGFQIFGSTAELAWLIDQIASARPPGRHALLINGDFVDFLAEEPGAAFDADAAIGKIDGIWQRFDPVFAALQRLLATPERLLVVNLGNHDLELALPWVRAHLTRRLAPSDEAAQARLVWITDGTGVRCRVAGARVVCVHGNEVDSWNVADHERLRRIGRDRQFGLDVDAWTPNAGSQLVTEVMNPIKRQFPFVDLLKPESEGVLPILAALNPGAHRKLVELAAVAGRLAWDSARRRSGFLDADASAPPSDYRPQPVFPVPDPQDSRRKLVEDVESAWRRDVEPISLVRGTQRQQLGFWSATAGFFDGKPRHEVLREALEHLDRDRSFDAAAPDATFRDLDAMIGADIDIVVAGHTHLERSLPRSRGRGHYFNSGTWARLMRIEPALRQDAAAFAQLFALLDGGSVDALDRARIAVAGTPMAPVIRRNTVVLIERRAAPAAGAHARLQHVMAATDGHPIRLADAGAAHWNGG